MLKDSALVSNDIFPLNSANALRQQKPRHIVFPVYEGVSLLDLAGPLEAFRVADAFAASERRAKYECAVVSARGGRVMTADDVELHTQAARIAAKDPIDTLVVPGGFLV
jgi:transcriptional regulator GlxA family with amidase domain